MTASPSSIASQPEAVYLELAVRDAADHASAMEAVLSSSLLCLACDARSVRAVWADPSAVPTDLVSRLRDLETLDTFTMREDVCALQLSADDTQQLGAVARAAHEAFERESISCLETLIVAPQLVWLVGRWDRQTAVVALERAIT